MLEVEKVRNDVVNMHDIVIDLTYFFKIPSSLVKKGKVGLVSRSEDSLNVVVSENTDVDRNVKQISNKFRGVPINITYVEEKSFIEVITQLYKKVPPLTQRKLQIGLTAEQDPTEFCDVLLILGTLKQASDIHIDPEEHYFVVTFRINGDLHEEVRLASSYYATIINRIKVLSNMRIAEKREPQDGYIKYELQGMNKYIELRTATLPTKFGERIAMRIIDGDTSFVGVDSLGFSQKDKTSFVKSLNYSFGFILVTGPTGSGKSTTLYTAMGMLINDGNLKIITFEDPIERDLEGVTQVQVEGEKVSLTKCLKSVLRHDPDIIMIGEIRDQETADIATRAAITGHLVLSTLHTNSAISTISRLIDVNVNPFIIAATLRLVTAQRLVRGLCPSCRIKRTITEEEGKVINRPNAIGKPCADAHPGGCEFCAGRGYKGRLSIIELLVNSPMMAEAILENPSEANLREVCKREGRGFLMDDGLDKVFEYKCTLEDVNRVSSLF